MLSTFEGLHSSEAVEVERTKSSLFATRMERDSSAVADGGAAVDDEDDGVDDSANDDRNDSG